MAEGDRKTSIQKDAAAIVEQVQQEMGCDFQTAVNAIIRKAGPIYLRHLQSFDTALANSVSPPPKAPPAETPPPPSGLKGKFGNL